VSSAIVRVPLGCSAPDHPPDAAHEVVFVEFHVNVADLPLAIELGVTLIEAVGLSVSVGIGVGANPAAFGALPPPVPAVPAAAPPQATSSSSDNPSKPWLVVIGIASPSATLSAPGMRVCRNSSGSRAAEFSQALGRERGPRRHNPAQAQDRVAKSTRS